MYYNSKRLWAGDILLCMQMGHMEHHLALYSWQNMLFLWQNILDIQLFITAAPRSDKTETLSLALALELLYAKSSHDLITGLRTRCIAGRPEWSSVLTAIKDKSQYPVTLFYCGAPSVADIVQPICDRLDFRFKKEIF